MRLCISSYNSHCITCRNTRCIVILFSRFLPIVLFLVLGCGLFVEGRVDETPLATDRGRGEGRGVQAERFSPWCVANLRRSLVSYMIKFNSKWNQTRRSKQWIKMISFTRNGVKGSDFLGVFLGEFDIFSMNEVPVWSKRGDISPRSFLLLLQIAIWVGFDELTAVKEATPPRTKGAQFLSWPERAAALLSVSPTELSIVLWGWRLAKCLGGDATSDMLKLATSPQETGSCRAEHIYSWFNVFSISSQRFGLSSVWLMAAFLTHWVNELHCLYKLRYGL